MLLWQEQGKSLAFLKIGFEMPAAGDLQLGRGSGFVPAENMQEFGQDAVGMDGETAQRRESTAAVPSAVSSWKRHCAENLVDSEHIELPDHIQTSSTTCAQQVQGVQGAFNAFTMSCMYSLKVAKAGLWDVGMLSALCRPL